ncbi:flagellar biosynthesis protein FlhB [Alkalimonas collagenimarina]|uniref:Flagellar biosynthetic protein FlhB n=1 Tax=Alkalimonas collagenimarina TaxID=400390 RepID=A0ABT9H3S9_9GAMM|nr:flagellar biosynthesis protein FlhB [Alkalimonas collagenimarina]MDP4537550.1 flagellar biosynthesis protein FlhB [Alkalimonas collagenimarina]
MADSPGGGEKTEQPTPKKINDAKEKGQIARSKDLGTAFVLISSSAAILLFGPMLAVAVLTIGKRMFSLQAKEIFETQSMLSVWGEIMPTLLTPMGYIFAFILVAAFVGNCLLGGFNFSWQAAGPKASKMSPLKGFKRMFGLQALVELGKSVLKVLVVIGMAYGLLRAFFGDIMTLSVMSAPNNIEDALWILGWLFFGLCCSVIIIALVDAPYQAWKHNKELMMTLQEVKDEHKNMEGDPKIKGQIRRRQMEMSMKRMMQEVPSADVIVTNPTHYSVALRYKQGRDRAPVVVAKGVDEMAMRIREVASEHKIPLVESPALARAIYYTTELDRPIPDALFAAVAQVLAYVYQLNLYIKGRGKRPRKLARELAVPKDYYYD